MVSIGGSMAARLGLFAAGAMCGVLAYDATFNTRYKRKEDIHPDYLESYEGSNVIRGKEILKFGVPFRASEVSYYSNHVLNYDQERKIPLWVAEHLTVDTLKGKANRKYSKFQPDPDIESHYSAVNADYLGSGWSRGHMAPAGDNKISQSAMNETFYLSNILPQNLENNAGFWNRLEIYCRELPQRFKHVRIISGPIMLPVKENGKKYIKYEVIGESEVAVPTHLYKIILAEKDTGTYIGAFVVPNEPISFDHHLTEYQVSVKDIERRIGFNLLPGLDKSDSANGDLCKLDGCNLMGFEEFELYFTARKLESSRTLRRLNKVWKELEEKGIKPDQYIEEVYERKLQELTAKEAQKSEL